MTGSGDVIRAYDISSPDEPELLGELDAHWHDVTGLRLWMRRSAVDGEPTKTKIEPWVVSAEMYESVALFGWTARCPTVYDIV